MLTTVALSTSAIFILKIVPRAASFEAFAAELCICFAGRCEPLFCHFEVRDLSHEKVMSFLSVRSMVIRVCSELSGSLSPFVKI